MDDAGTFLTAFVRCAAELEPKPFLLDHVRKRHLTRKDVLDHAARIAAGAHARGIRSGDTVIVVCTDQILSFTTFLGLMSLGAVTLLADFRQSVQELKALKERAGASFILSDFPSLLKKEVAHPIQEITDPEFEITEGGCEDDPVFIATSSGTTGGPKLKAVTGGHMLKQALQMARDNARGAFGDALSCLNLAFSATRAVWCRNALSGHQVYVLSQFFKLSEIDTALRLGAVDEAALPPRLIRMLVEAYGKAEDSAPRYPDLLKLQSVGGGLTGDDLRAAYETLTPRLTVTYSSTQTGVVSRLNGPDVLTKPYSVGRCLEPDHVVIGSPDTPCAPNEAGPIWVWVDAPKSGWVSPGDRGFLDDDGFLHISGRDEDYLCRNGVSFWGGPLADQLRVMPEVRDAILVSIPTENVDEDEIVAAVEADPRAAKIICTWINRNMSSLHRPSRVLVTPSLPRNSADKIIRHKIRSQIEDLPEHLYELTSNRRS